MNKKHNDSKITCSRLDCRDPNYMLCHVIRQYENYAMFDFFYQTPTTRDLTSFEELLIPHLFSHILVNLMLIHAIKNKPTLSFENVMINPNFFD